MRAALVVFADLGPDAPKIDDFVSAAGISRGTFYNYFDNVDELLAATCKWTMRHLIATIEGALKGLDGPALRVGIGGRLFLAKAQSDPVWSRFAARVWSVGGLEPPARDLDEGLRLGVFRAPSPEVARDLLLGALRESLRRIGTERTAPAYGAQIAEVCLHALGTDPRKIAAVIDHPLPSLRPTEPASGAEG